MTECARCSIEEATEVFQFNEDLLCKECLEYSENRVQELLKR